MTSSTLVPSTLEEQKTYAELVARSTGMVPAAYQGKPANIFVAIQYGSSLGLEPMASLQGINVIHGKPTLSAQAMLGLLKSQHFKVHITKDDGNQRVTVEVIDPDDPDYSTVSVWDMAKARKAGLGGDQNWTKHPMTMLKWRAVSEAAREAAPHLFLGLGGAYTKEELEESVTVENVEETPRPRSPYSSYTRKPEPVEPETVEAEPVDPEPLNLIIQTMRENGVDTAQKAQLVLTQIVGVENVNDIPADKLETLCANLDGFAHDIQQTLGDNK